MAGFEQLIEPGHLYSQQNGLRVRYDSELWHYDRLRQTTTMFCHRSNGPSWGKYNVLRVSMYVPLLPHDLSEAEAADRFLDFAQVMQAAVYGAMLGWAFLEPEPTRRLPGDDYDDILVSSHIPKESRFDIDGLKAHFGIDLGSLREIAKADALRYICSVDSARGHDAVIDVDDLLQGHHLRIQVTRDFLLSCLNDLKAEDYICCREPGKYGFKPHPPVEHQVTIESLDKVVTQRMLEIGKRNNWLPSRTSEAIEPPKTGDPKGDEALTNNVFIIHGHDKGTRLELKEMLETRFGLNPVIMMEQPGSSRTFIEKFEEIAKTCSYAIAILTPDDLVAQKGDGEEFRQPRPNVLFELGWFVGHLSRKRVLLVAREGTAVSSDLFGIEQIRFKDDIKEKIPELEREIDEWREADPSSQG